MSAQSDTDLLFGLRNTCLYANFTILQTKIIEIVCH